MEEMQRQHKVLSRLSQIPQNILLLHGNENIPEFVLHELCHEHCFDLGKAAYFVDNPDFNCLKGVAGVSRLETFAHSPWEHPAEFTQHMMHSPFNKQVRSVLKQSIYNNTQSMPALAQELAQQLGMNHHAVCSWKMKHDNHGLLLFEKCQGNDASADELMLAGATMLGFCPIF